jgi:hypothetical protein
MKKKKLISAVLRHLKLLSLVSKKQKLSLFRHLEIHRRKDQAPDPDSDLYQNVNDPCSLFVYLSVVPAAQPCGLRGGAKTLLISAS